MPNRIIKESAFTSDKIAQLSDFEFRLWVGLITQADDAGRGDARPAIIKGRVFALRERTALKDIEIALRNLAAAGCVFLYTVDGKPYYEFPNWTAHQRVRNAIPKFPGSDKADNSPQLAATRGESPQSAALIQSNPIQSESKKESKESMRFAPPSIDEVAAYCKERGNSINAEQFVDFYTSKGWRVGSQTMKDWKAAVRTWERRDGGKKVKQPKSFAEMWREMPDE